MFKIRFVPVRLDEPLVVVKAGDVLTLNGDSYDFSSLPEGATIPRHGVPLSPISDELSVGVPSPWIDGPVERIGGDIHLVLILPFRPSPEPYMAFPEPIEVTDDGPVDIPVDRVVTTEIVGDVARTTIRRWHQPDEVIDTPVVMPIVTPEAESNDVDA